MAGHLVFAEKDVLERVDGDVEFLKELTEQFLATFPEQVSDLGSTIVSGDYYQVERKAHALKGTLKNLGAMESGSIAYSIEETAKAKNQAALQLLLETFEKSVKEYERQLSAFLATAVP